MPRKRQLDEDGNEQRTVRLTLTCTVSLPPGTPEDEIVNWLENNDISWSAQCELTDWEYVGR